MITRRNAVTITALFTSSTAVILLTAIVKITTSSVTADFPWITANVIAANITTTTAATTVLT